MKVFLLFLILGCANASRDCSKSKEAHASCAHKQKKFPKRDELGIWNYCTEKYGYILGRSGIKSLEECPEHTRTKFLNGYSTGRKEHSLFHFNEGQKKIQSNSEKEI